MDDVRFCFTVYEDNEQYEDGDTLVHTFYKEQWPVCKTKWFYFWGSINGEDCVSTSPIFKYHNDGVSPVPTPDILRTFNSVEWNYFYHNGAAAWETYDLSHDVSPDATGVLLKIMFSIPGTWGYWGARKPGSTGDHIVTAYSTNWLYALVGLSDTKTIELYSTVGCGMYVWITGYFNKNIVWLDDCPDRLTPDDASWHAVDWSDVAPGAQAGIFLVGDRSSRSWIYGLRPFGSTNNWPYYSTGHYAICKLVDGKAEYWNEQFQPSTPNAFTMVGYVKAGGLFHTDAVEIFPPGEGLNKVYVIQGLHAYPTLAIMECIGDGTLPAGLSRKYGSQFVSKSAYPRHVWHMTHPDTPRRIALHRDKVGYSFRLHGTLDSA